jgi:hypothetical protein
MKAPLSPNGDTIAVEIHATLNSRRRCNGACDWCVSGKSETVVHVTLNYPVSGSLTFDLSDNGRVFPTSEIAADWLFSTEGVPKRRLTPLVQKVGFRKGPTTAWWRVGKGKVTPQNLQLLCFDTSSTLSGRWSQRDVNGGFRGPAVIRARVLPVKSSDNIAVVRIAANFIAREWRLTRRPYDLRNFDPSPTLENRKLDVVGEPVSEGSQVSALSLAQRSLIDDARQSARRSPLAPLCKESGRCVDDRRVVVIIEYGKDRRDGQLHEGKLLLFESARVDAAFSIESENGKRVPNDAHRVSVHKLDRDAGHSYSLLRKNGQTVACRIPQHPVEPGA